MIRQSRSNLASLLATGLLALATCGLAVPANAEPARSTQSDHGSLTGPPVMAIVSIKDQRISLYDANGDAMRARISSGATTYETPVGTYSILQKNKEHYSNVYDDAAMPFMQRITWSGVALHEGQLPGFPASHGCVRLPNSFAEQIFPLTKIGMRVIVARDNVAPVEIAHASLFKPAPLNASVAATRASYDDSEIDERGPRPFLADLRNWPERQAEMDALQTIATQKAAEAEQRKAPIAGLKAVVAEKTKKHAATAKILRAADKAKQSADDKAARAERDLAYAKDPARLTPWETSKAKADAAVVKATEQLAKATAAVDVATTDRERRKAERALRAAERNKQAAVARASDAERDLAAAKLPARYKKQEEAAAKAAAAAAAAAQKHADAAAVTQAAAAAMQSATEDLASAEAILAAATNAATEARRKTLPISIFISRKTQRLYIRQGHEPVADVPISIAEPDKPIGTHVFTAVDYTTGANDLRWTAVSLARRPGREVAELSGKSRKRDDGMSEPFATDATIAASVLDRLTLPPEVMDRVTASAWPGSSLIVSDEALHKETNNATDFIVLISGEPQGGIKRRPKPAPVRQFYYGDDPWGPNGNIAYDKYGRKIRIQKKPTFFDWW